MEQIHPELRQMANRIPKLPVTSGNLWLWRFLINLMGMPKKPKDVEIQTLFIPDKERKTKIKLRIYKPRSLVSLAPGLVWLHGGGYVMGRPEGDDPTCIYLARELGIVVVSVKYHYAPRFPFPAGLEDAYTALKWMHSQGRRIGIDNRIGIGGESAGGGLAAALAQLAHDRKEVPIAAQLLIYPMLDDRTCNRTNIPNAESLTWDPISNQFGWEAYLGHKGGTTTPPNYSVPARRADLSGLPPAWIGVGTLDLFHDEDVEYAQRLKEHGVECELHIVPGAFHGFDVIAPQAKVVQEFQKSQVASLKKFLFSVKRKFTASDLISGKIYRVTKAFTDYDSLVHNVGENWIFTGKSFLPYEDGLTLFTEKDGKSISFRMQWRNETQGQIIDDFSEYVEEQ